MAKWSDFKSSINSISKEELTIIETLTYLQAERIKRGITQKEFAERIGMKQPQLAKIERVDSIPALGTLNRYAQGLGLEIRMQLIPQTTK